MLREVKIERAWTRPSGRKKSAMRMFCEDQVEQFIELGFECAKFTGWEKFSDDFDSACWMMRKASAGSGANVSVHDGKIYLVRED